MFSTSCPSSMHQSHKISGVLIFPIHPCARLLSRPWKKLNKTDREKQGPPRHPLRATRAAFQSPPPPAPTPLLSSRRRRPAPPGVAPCRRRWRRGFSSIVGSFPSPDAVVRLLPVPVLIVASWALFSTTSERCSCMGFQWCGQEGCSRPILARRPSTDLFFPAQIWSWLAGGRRRKVIPRSDRGRACLPLPCLVGG